MVKTAAKPDALRRVKGVLFIGLSNRTVLERQKERERERERERGGGGGGGEKEESKRYKGTR